jgi:hypothetical protein
MPTTPAHSTKTSSLRKGRGRDRIFPWMVLAGGIAVTISLDRRRPSSVVEDEDGVRDMAAEILRMAGYNVLEARDGMEAPGVVGRGPGPMHVPVTDVIMPVVNGREAWWPA